MRTIIITVSIIAVFALIGVVRSARGVNLDDLHHGVHSHGGVTHSH